jgi:hypothetical protein
LFLIKSIKYLNHQNNNSALKPLLAISAAGVTDPRYYGLVTTSTGVNDATGTSITSNNIQLQIIPERILVFVRRIRDSSLDCTQTDSFLTIQSIRVNFNNQSGLLSTFTQQQLYEATTTTGGVKCLSWEEFAGVTIGAGSGPTAYSPSTGVYSAAPYSEFAGISAGGLGNTNSPAGIRLVPTTGTVLSLAFGSCIQIPEEYYSVGSIGQFNLQVTVTVANLTKDNWTNYELVVVVQNPGILITDRGSGSTFVGLLTKDAVLETKDSPDHVTLAYAKHMVGGSICSPCDERSCAGYITHGISSCKELAERPYVSHPIT